MAQLNLWYADPRRLVATQFDTLEAIHKVRLFCESARNYLVSHSLSRSLSVEQGGTAFLFDQE